MLQDPHPGAPVPDIATLPDYAMVTAADLRSLLRAKEDGLARLVSAGVLPPPIRLANTGASPRLWTVGEVRSALAHLVQRRGVR